MKFVRSLVLLAIIGAVPGLVLQALGQQEIDPEHFDQAELAKAANPSSKPKTSPKGASLKQRQKPATYARNASRSTTTTDQPKGEKRMAALRSTSE